MRAMGIVSLVVMSAVSPLVAVENARAAGAQQRCLVVEVYYDSGAKDPDRVRRLHEWLSGRPGIVAGLRDVRENAANQQRLDAIATYFRVEDAPLPLVYGCNGVRVWKGGDEGEFRRRCEQLFQLTVFVRRGCQHCEAAKRFLPGYLAEYPALRVSYRDVITDRHAVSDLSELVRRYQQAAVSYPVMHLCQKLLVGFENDPAMRVRLDGVLSKWSAPCPEPQRRAPPGREVGETSRPTNGSAVITGDPRRPSVFALPSINHRDWPLALPALSSVAAGAVRNAATASTLLSPGALGRDASAEPPVPELPVPELPVPELPVPELPVPELPVPDGRAPGSEGELSGSRGAGSEPLVLPSAEKSANPSDDHAFQITLPWFGTLDVRRIGLPLFTLAVGLIDGFNPCAMWVLLFLLSLLVNLKDRWRILAVAGTFVFISGLAYFAFMAAWLNVFLFIGYLRPVQIALGVLGILVGAIHIKDFFAFKRGVTLSIPESAKPTIYAKTRAILTARNLCAAIVGASVLAVMVNVVELLCTAGLPALYTEVLARQGIPLWKTYAYLALYISAYMFDDSVMVGAVVVTLGKKKLQENEGQWLKLISGLVILVLGLLVIFYPDFLM